MKISKLLIIIALIGISNSMFAQNTVSKKQSEPLLVLDAHIHHGFPTHQGLEFPDAEKIESDLNYLKELNYNLVVYPLPNDRSRTENLAERLTLEVDKLKQLSKSNNSFDIVSYPIDNEKIKKTDRIHFMFAIEHFRGPIFKKDIHTVKKYKDLGVNYITLVNSEDDYLFTSLEEESKLNDFGKRIIAEMNKQNLKIDLAHLSEANMLDIMKHSKDAVLFSHSGSGNISGSEYNITDKVLYALKENNGLFMISFRQNRLFKDDDEIGDGVLKFADHVDHLKSIIGVDKIGIGTDHQARGKYMAEGLKDEASFQGLKNCLLERGYTHSEIAGIFYKNYLKFIQE